MCLFSSFAAELCSRGESPDTINHEKGGNNNRRRPMFDSSNFLTAIFVNCSEAFSSKAGNRIIDEEVLTTSGHADVWYMHPSASAKGTPSLVSP